jgi:hypothetical protein
LRGVHGIEWNEGGITEEGPQATTEDGLRYQGVVRFYQDNNAINYLALSGAEVMQPAASLVNRRFEPAYPVFVNVMQDVLGSFLDGQASYSSWWEITDEKQDMGTYQRHWSPRGTLASTLAPY